MSPGTVPRHPRLLFSPHSTIVVIFVLAIFNSVSLIVGRPSKEGVSDRDRDRTQIINRPAPMPHRTSSSYVQYPLFYPVVPVQAQHILYFNTHPGYYGNGK